MNNSEYYIKNEDDINKIRGHMIDEKSKMIYDALVNLNITNDLAYLNEAVKICGHKPSKLTAFHVALNQMKKEGRPLIFYGLGEATEKKFNFAKMDASRAGAWHLAVITSIEWDAFSDKNYEKYGNMFEGKPVISPGQIPKDAIIVVGTHKYYEDIKEEFISKGYTEKDIFCYPYLDTEVYGEEQYFDSEFMEAAQESIFIDGGCCTCDSIENFIKWNDGHGYKEILSFEPDPHSYKFCKSRIDELGLQDTVKLYNAGLSDKEETLSFMAKGDGASAFSSDGDVKVEVKTLDSIVAEKDVSFIKLDIEGYELETLKGACKTITRCHPKLAVCLYHKLNDLIDIPKYILSLSEEYNFHIRIYSNIYLEIVLYAI